MKAASVIACSRQAARDTATTALSFG